MASLPPKVFNLLLAALAVGLVFLLFGRPGDDPSHEAKAPASAQPAARK